MTEEQWDRVISVNLKSCFNLTKAVMRTMLKARSGSIVNISSVVGVQGNAGQANYAASKAGILGFTKSVALELGSRNIRCNAIAPGFIETEMTAKLDADTVQGWRDAIPLKRGGTPEDVANLCVFLASDMSAYITGQTLNVDGGSTSSVVIAGWRWQRSRVCATCSGYVVVVEMSLASAAIRNVRSGCASGPMIAFSRS